MKMAGGFDFYKDTALTELGIGASVVTAEGEPNQPVKRLAALAAVLPSRERLAAATAYATRSAKIPDFENP